MKKVPTPDVRLEIDDEGTVVVFEWDSISFRMFDDEALRLARTIYDVLEEPPETDGGPLSPWGET